MFIDKPGKEVFIKSSGQIAFLPLSQLLHVNWHPVLLPASYRFNS